VEEVRFQPGVKKRRGDGGSGESTEKTGWFDVR